MKPAKKFTQITPPPAAIVLELSVGEVAVVIAHRPRAGVRRHHRPGGDLENVVHTGRPEVRDIEHDAESLHLGDCRHTGAGQATAGGVLAASVGECGPPEVGERGDPDAQPVHGPEQLDVGVDRRAALQRQHEGDATGGERRVDRRSIETELDRVGVALGDPVGRFDHPQRLAQGAFGPVGVVDEHGQDLQVDPALTQLGQPVLPEVGGPALGRPGDDRHQQIVVSVGDDRRRVQLSGHQPWSSVPHPRRSAPQCIVVDLSAPTNPRMPIVGLPR